jgi:CHAD domain-containing protein
VKKRGRHFAALDQDHRHRLRLAAKLLRDGARIFAADPGIGKRGRRGLLHLSTLLDGLGHARDLFSEPALLAQVQSRGPMLCVRAVSADNGRALCGAWHDFEKAPLPWLKR